MDPLQSLQRFRPRRLAAHTSMLHRHLGELPFDRQIRIERCHRVLENQRQAITAQLVERRGPHTQQLHPLEAGGTRGAAVGRQTSP